ncbi:MAG: SDR family NAD(P)-dependent oxidoreductase [Limisphaerales bacterium]
MKRILVTGGTRGLGLAVCHRLLAQGYRVAATARRLSPELSELLEQSKGRLEFFAADLTKENAVPRLAKVARLLEGLDGLVANAGMGADALLTLTPDRPIRECIQVNLVAPIILAREVIKGMLGHGGSLVFVSSVAARTGLPGLSVYAASKGGLIAFSRTIAREYGKWGIRSNCVLPGFLDTEMTASLDSQSRRRILKRTALTRLGHPIDVVGAICFLLSDDSRYITGTEMMVDGGFTA